MAAAKYTSLNGGHLIGGVLRGVRSKARLGIVLFLAFGMIATSMEIPPASASAAMTLAVDYTPDSSDVATEVTPGSKVDLTAIAPVSVAGTTNQMVQIELEPELVLTSASDVRAPAGWLISYSTDGTTWTTVAPTTTPVGQQFDLSKLTVHSLVKELTHLVDKLLQQM